MDLAAAKLMDVTGLAEEAASSMLAECGGDVSRAVERWLAGGAGGHPSGESLGDCGDAAAAGDAPKRRHSGQGGGGGKRARTEVGVRAPLAERMRPRDLGEVVGLGSGLAGGGALQEMMARDAVPSLIFWGPPGCGKTTLCRLIAGESARRLVSLSAVTAGVKEIREAVAEAKGVRALLKKGVILFVDEIHRWSKAQQDAL